MERTLTQGGEGGQTNTTENRSLDSKHHASQSCNEGENKQERVEWLSGPSLESSVDAEVPLQTGINLSFKNPRGADDSFVFLLVSSSDFLDSYLINIVEKILTSSDLIYLKFIFLLLVDIFLLKNCLLYKFKGD